MNENLKYMSFLLRDERLEGRYVKLLAAQQGERVDLGCGEEIVVMGPEDSTESNAGVVKIKKRLYVA